MLVNLSHIHLSSYVSNRCTQTDLTNSEKSWNDQLQILVITCLGCLWIDVLWVVETGSEFSFGCAGLLRVPKRPQIPSTNLLIHHPWSFQGRQLWPCRLLQAQWGGKPILQPTGNKKVGFFNKKLIHSTIYCYNLILIIMPWLVSCLIGEPSLWACRGSANMIICSCEGHLLY